jgi:hypothetical protein
MRQRGITATMEIAGLFPRVAAGAFLANRCSWPLDRKGYLK